ncbi:beta strand repeat-containing protein [Aquirufa nivalisilvae]
MYHSIAGFMNWRETNGSTIRTMVFYPSTGTNEVITINSGSYTITDTKALGLTLNGQILNMSAGVITGNAATVSQMLTSLNDYLNAQPKLNITSTLSVTEALAGVNAVATVTLSAAATQTTTVNYTTSGGTATNNTDYTNTTGTLTFAVGESSKTITVPVLDDLIAEVTETFNITIADAVNAAIVTNTTVVSILDNDPAPSNLSYPTPNVYTVGAAILSLNPSVSGNVVSYALTTGTLPAGLSFSTVDGKITGTPTAITSLQSFTVTATNARGNTVSNTFTITVNDVAPTGLSYNTPNVYLTGSAITSLNPLVTGNVVSYALTTGTLPTGLSFSTVNGRITGTPTTVTSIRSFTVTATNSGGNTVSNTFTITVNDPAPTNLTYSTPKVYVVGTPITSLNPTVTGNVVSYALTTGTLPDGLSFSTVDGKITGTPTTVTALRSFTVTATNTGGSTVSNTFTITVNATLPPAPSNLSYNTPNVYTVGTAISSLNPTVTNSVDSYALTSGTLPDGLSFNTNDGTITGSPTTATALRSFTVTATNVSGNTVSNTFTITVNPADPSGLTYPTPNVYKVGTAITSLDPTITGIVDSYALTTGTLPAGLSFSTVNGKITGTPTAVTALTSFTVTATNVSGNTVSNTFTITGKFWFTFRYRWRWRF